MSDDDIGYGKPPKAGRFKPGQSGNPRGRPKGSKNFSTVLKSKLSEQLTVNEGGKTRRVTKMEAVIMQLINKALKGDPRATANLLREINKHWPENYEDLGQATALPPSAEDMAIIEDFMRRWAADRSGGADGE